MNPNGLPRRYFLRSAAAAVVSPTLVAAASAPLARLSDIDHIIVLMKENRSFDHYFGSLSGVRGFDDPQAIRLAGGQSVFQQPDPLHPDGHVLPFRLDTTLSSAQRLRDLSHAWGPLHVSWNQGAMDCGFRRIARWMAKPGR